MPTQLISTVPNILTISRVCVVPIIVAIYFIPENVISLAHQNIAATVLFIVACLTDLLDGWVARRWQATSSFGEFLDPVADKLLVCATLITLVQLDRVNTIIALVIIGREVVISVLREWMSTAKHNLRVSNWGKTKTAMQFVGIGFLLYYEDFFFLTKAMVITIGDVLIFIAAALTLISMFDYLYNALIMLRKKNQE